MSTTTKMAIDDVMISFYPDSMDPSSTLQMSVREYIDGIRIGTWGKHQAYVRAALGDKKEYDKRKRQGGGATPGATLKYRKLNDHPENLIAYSGFQVHDLDHLDADRQAVKELLTVDPYVYAVWDSIGGEGLCFLVRVDSDRWDDSFLGVQDYMTKKYGLFSKFDPAGKDASRLRYNGSDPDVRVKELDPPIFKEYPPKRKPKEKKVSQAFIHTQDDFDFVFRQIIDSGVDLTPHYQQRLAICFALVSKFGDGGEAYFDRICQNHAEYDERKTARMWKSAMGYGSQKTTIATFYHFAKEAGLDISRPFTREVTSIAAAHKKQGGTVGGTVDTLKKMNGFDPAETEPIVKQVYESKEEFKTEETLFSQLEMYIRTNYPMRRNEITRYIEDDKGRGLVDSDFNGIWVEANKVLGDKLSDKMVNKLIHSPFIKSYNPIKDFFTEHRDRKPVGVIKALAKTISTSSGFDEGSFMPQYAEFIIRKWLLGLISSVFDEHSPIVLVLTGPPNTGKTEWFRRLLPRELHHKYFAETTWPVHKDTDILMAESLITFNDEWKGETVKNPETLKGFASAAVFSLREPYGSSNVKRRRLAVMCGTSNRSSIVKDPDNNRKIFGLHVNSINFEAYNRINKTDLLMEAYHAYMAEERHHLTNDEIADIAKNVRGFEHHTLEHELIEKYYRKPENIKDAELCSQADAVVYLRQMSGFNNIDKDVVTREFKTLGYPYQDKSIWYPPDGKSKRGYWVYRSTVAT
ncbi:VapE domain-containing protein [Spirosoma arcticum]